MNVHLAVAVLGSQASDAAFQAAAQQAARQVARQVGGVGNGRLDIPGVSGVGVGAIGSAPCQGCESCASCLGNDGDGGGGGGGGGGSHEDDKSQPPSGPPADNTPHGPENDRNPSPSPPDDDRSGGPTDTASRLDTFSPPTRSTAPPAEPQESKGFFTRQYERFKQALVDTASQPTAYTSVPSAAAHVAVNYVDTYRDDLLENLADFFRGDPNRGSPSHTASNIDLGQTPNNFQESVGAEGTGAPGLPRPSASPPQSRPLIPPPAVTTPAPPAAPQPSLISMLRRLRVADGGHPSVGYRYDDDIYI